MAIKVAIHFVENVKVLIIQEADRLGGVWAEIRGIEQELEFVAVLLERSEVQNQITEDLLTEIRNVTSKAEDLIYEYAVIVSQRQRARYIMPIYWIKQRRSAVKLRKYIDKIRRFKQRLMSEYAEEERLMPQSGDHQDDVPRHLWRFIYYFLLFPADMEIPTRRLIVLWVAEGLVSAENRYDHQSVEDIAEHDLNELIKRRLVRVTKKKLNGKAQACLLEDGIRDKWLMEAKRANFFQSGRKQVRRLVDQTTATGDADADASFIRIHGNPNILNLVPNYGDVISFLSFDTQEGSKPGEDIGNFLRKCIEAERFLWLRMLDLEKVFRPKLPDTLGRLVRLKYLGLRWTYLQQLPDFVNKLLQLRVLDVKHTYITALPSSIWRMKDLRHLYLSEAYRTRFPHRPSGEVTLTYLQTLWGAFIDEDTHVEGGLDTLGGIRKLGLSCRPRSSASNHMSKQLEAVDKWISKQGRLQILRLKSRDKEGEAAHLHLTTLETNTNLSTIYLLGKLSPHVVEKFPKSLTDITLSGSELDIDPMEFLGTLPKLQILRFLAKSVLHSKLHCLTGGFPQLKVFHVWCLENLEEWQVEEGSLPCLASFEIRSCRNLVKLPHQLQYVETLEKFRLTNMPEVFMHETEVTQPRLWAKDRACLTTATLFTY